SQPGPTLAGGTDVVFAQGKFVVVGGDRISTSTDGATWNQHGLGGEVNLRSIVYGTDQFVAVGSRFDEVTVSELKTVATSPDGITWTQQPLDTLGRLTAIAFGSGRFVALGSGGVVVSSTDGITWTDAPLVWGERSGVAYGNGRFVAVGVTETFRGNLGVILTSADGMTWNQTYSEP